jgi:hypothetical protein
MKKLNPKVIRTIKAVCVILIVPLLVSVKNDPAVAYKKKVGVNEVIICPVNRVSETRTLPLSEIIEYCEMIRLEQGSNAIINPWFSVISDKHIMIVSRGAVPVKLFDRANHLLPSGLQRKDDQHSSHFNPSQTRRGDIYKLYTR